MEDKAFVPKKWPQIMAAGAASFGGLSLGATLAWPSPAIKDLLERNSFENFEYPSETASWIVAIVSLGALVSGPVAGFGIEKIGRKRTLVILAIPFVGSNLLVAFSTGTGMMLIGRALCGFCAGIATLAAPTYIAEIATDSIRGALGSGFNAMLTIGTVMTFLLGDVMSWYWLSVVHAAIPVILLVGMVFLPESPIYSLAAGNIDDARKSLVWLRGAESSDQIEPELQVMKQRVEYFVNMKKNTTTIATLRELMKGGVWQPTLISFMLVFYNQMSAVNAMLAYSTTIVESTGSGLNPNVVSAILGSVVLVSTLFMDTAGRRTLLFISEIGMILAFVVIGLFFYLQEEEKDKYGTDLEGAITWMPLIALFVYNLCYNVGVGPLPRVIANEILPTHVKGLTLALSLSFNWILAFAVTKTFDTIREALQASGFFWLYAGICTSGIIFIFFFVPETKGKSIGDIAKGFKKKEKVEVSVIS